MSFRRVLPLAGWVVSLLVGLVVFHGLGQGPMAAPPIVDPSSWGDWVAARDPLIAAAALLRMLVLALSWYLVGVTTIGLVARLLRAARLVRVADALTVPMVRRLLQSALGVGLATTMVGAATVPTDGQPEVSGPESGVTMVLASSGEASVTSRDPGRDPQGSPDSGPVAMRLLEQESTSAGEAVRMRLVTEDARGEITLRAMDDHETGEDDVADARHRVVAGESLWSIAQDALVDRFGREPMDVEVLDYWQRVVEHNRQHLADPDNPDLIFPGDMVALPDAVEEV